MTKRDENKVSAITAYIQPLVIALMAQGETYARAFSAAWCLAAQRPEIIDQVGWGASATRRVIEINHRVRMACGLQ